MPAWVKSPSITPSLTSPSQMASPMGEFNSKWMRSASSTTFDNGKPDTPWMSIVARRPSPDAVMSTAKGRAVGPGMEISPSQRPSRSSSPIPFPSASPGASGSAGAGASVGVDASAGRLVVGVVSVDSADSGAEVGLAAVASGVSAVLVSAGVGGSASGVGGETS